MTTTARHARPVTYIPGAGRFRLERRTPGYRTWRGRGDMGWCAECLLCGEWASSQGSRADAARWGAVRHPGWCHVVNGCHCREPHITAVMGARLGIGGEYPRELAWTLYALAGGARKYCPPAVDLRNVPHHPLMTWLEGRVRDGYAAGAERAWYATVLPIHEAWLAAHWARLAQHERSQAA